MSGRIVVTGMGAVTPVGTGVENYWRGLLEGRCGIGPISGIDASSLAVKIAAEVRDFVPRDYLSSRLTADLDRFMQFAYVSALEALSDSGLQIEPERTGIVMGTALGGLARTGETRLSMEAQGKRISPRFLSTVMGNIAPAQFAIDHNIKGPSLTISTACSSGGDAIMTALMLLRAGAADSVMVMGGESAVSPLLFESLAKAGALSRELGSRPFDSRRDGFVVGEGGGAMVLETEEHALARGADIKAVLLSCANNTDAYHTVTPEPEGRGAADCMKLALAGAGLAPEDIGYINAHGTATPMGDVAETRAIKAVFGRRAVPVSSTKGATGHLMGAGGLTEAIACVKALQTGVIPPNINCPEPDPECSLNIIHTPERLCPRAAMSNALGFGGQNSSVVLGRYE